MLLQFRWVVHSDEVYITSIKNDDLCAVDLTNNLHSSPTAITLKFKLIATSHSIRIYC